MNRLIKPMFIDSDNIDKSCYDLCSFILRNDYRNGMIISESGLFLDKLSEYMKKTQMPNSYYMNTCRSNKTGFILVDKHNASKVLDSEVLHEFQELISQKGYSLNYCVFEGDLYFFTIKLKSEYAKIDLSMSEIPLHLRNHEIKEMFLESFRIAESEIDICSPWMSKKVVNKQLVRLMREALFRNVKIKILYGLDTNSDEFNIYRSNTSDMVAELLKKEFSDFYLKTFFIQRDNIHYKVVLCDNKFKLEGSFNYLSFDGEYIDESVRKEGSPFGTNINEILEIRRHYFESIR